MTARSAIIPTCIGRRDVDIRTERKLDIAWPCRLLNAAFGFPKFLNAKHLARLLFLNVEQGMLNSEVVRCHSAFNIRDLFGGIAQLSGYYKNVVGCERKNPTDREGFRMSNKEF